MVCVLYRDFFAGGKNLSGICIVRERGEWWRVTSGEMVGNLFAMGTGWVVWSRGMKH